MLRQITFFLSFSHFSDFVLAFQYPNFFWKFGCCCWMTNDGIFAQTMTQLFLNVLCGHFSFWLMCSTFQAEHHHCYNDFESKITNFKFILSWLFGKLEHYRRIAFVNNGFCSYRKIKSRTRINNNIKIRYRTVISKKTNYRIEWSIGENTMIFIAHHLLQSIQWFSIYSIFSMIFFDIGVLFWAAELS